MIINFLLSLDLLICIVGLFVNLYIILICAYRIKNGHNGPTLSIGWFFFCLSGVYIYAVGETIFLKSEVSYNPLIVLTVLEIIALGLIVLASISVGIFLWIESKRPYKKHGRTMSDVFEVLEKKP